MLTGTPSDLPYGGICLERFSPDACCASQARAALTRTMRDLAFPQVAIDDGTLAVSELTTNAYLHTKPERPPTGPELWIWARTRPNKELVVAVFDACRSAMPELTPGHLLDDHGKGLGIVSHVASAWGCHLSRSRVSPVPLAGKVTWFALPLPRQWPSPPQPIPPARAAQCLTHLLRSRGLQCDGRSDDMGISLIAVEDLLVWVYRKTFTWRAAAHTLVKHPLIDLQETAEHVVQTLEEAGRPAPL